MEGGNRVLGDMMVRKVGIFVVVITLAVGASAGVAPGTISGFVKNSSGVPQMGAAVEVLTAAALQPQVLYTVLIGRDLCVAALILI